MSIIIKGMDMPKASNEDCIAVIRSNGKVEVWQTGMKEFEAEAIQIPKDHGRLIDAKLLADTINKAIQDGTFISKSIWEWIGDAPTILEAEGE